MNSTPEMIHPESRLQNSLSKLSSTIDRTHAVITSLKQEYKSLGGSEMSLNDSSLIQPLQFEIGGLEAFGRKLIGKFTPEQRKQQIINSYHELNGILEDASNFKNTLFDVTISHNTRIENKLVTEANQLELSLINTLKQARSKNDKANEVVTLTQSIPATLDVINNVSYEPDSDVVDSYQQDLVALHQSEEESDPITMLNNQIREAELKMIESSIESEIATFDELVTYARTGIGNLIHELKEVIYIGLSNRFQVGLDFHNELVAFEKSEFSTSWLPLTIELKNGHLNLYSQSGKTYRVLNLRTKIQNQINEERSPKSKTKSKISLTVSETTNPSSQTSEVDNTSLPNPTTTATNKLKSAKPKTILIKSVISETTPKPPILKQVNQEYNALIDSCLSQYLSPRLVDDKILQLSNYSGEVVQTIEIKDQIKQNYFSSHQEELLELAALKDTIVLSLIKNISEYKESNPDVSFQVVVAKMPDQKLNLGFYPIEQNGNRGKFNVVRIGTKHVVRSGLLINNYPSLANLILNDPRLSSVLTQ
jgi:hypothetical protein